MVCHSESVFIFPDLFLILYVCLFVFSSHLGEFFFFEMQHTLKYTSELFSISSPFFPPNSEVVFKKRQIPSSILYVRKNQETSNFGKSSDDSDNYPGLRKC